MAVGLEGLSERPDGLSGGSEGLPEGSDGLLERYKGLPRETDGWTYISSYSTGLQTLSRPLPKNGEKLKILDGEQIKELLEEEVRSERED